MKLSTSDTKHDNALPCADCHYAECRYAECRYAECRYAECRSANFAVHCLHVPMQCFQAALAYFATAVSYTCKMFMKVAPGV